MKHKKDGFVARLFFIYRKYSGLTLNRYGVASLRLAVLSVLSAASSPCPDLNLIHYSGKSDDLKRIDEDHDNGNRGDVAQRAQPQI